MSDANTVIKDNSEMLAKVSKGGLTGTTYLKLFDKDTSGNFYLALTSAEAHKLAQWIIDNIEEPDPLPTEDGVYIPSTAGVEHGPLLFTRYDGHWDRERLARQWAESVGLTKLVKEGS